jgi:hypothetical protein
MKAMVFECVVSLMFPAPARVHAGSPSEQHRTAPRWPLPTSMQASKVPPLPGRVLMPAAHHLFSAQDPAAPRCTRRRRRARGGGFSSGGSSARVPRLRGGRPRAAEGGGRACEACAFRVRVVGRRHRPSTRCGRGGCQRQCRRRTCPPPPPPRPRAHPRSSPPLLRAGGGGAALHAAADEPGEAAGGAAPCPRAAACSCPQLTASSPRRRRRHRGACGG